MGSGPMGNTRSRPICEIRVHRGKTRLLQSFGLSSRVMEFKVTGNAAQIILAICGGIMSDLYSGALYPSELSERQVQKKEVLHGDGRQARCVTCRRS
jgi:hypothetical protein